MSHFTVLIIGENIEEQMARYEESTKNPQFRTFVNTEKEDLIEYMTKTLKVVILPNGKKTTEYDQDYKVYDPKLFYSKYVFPEGSITREEKFCEFFETFEEYKDKWCGSETRDAEMGEYGYWNNPESRWDWYSVGGRWTGFFKPKAGASGTLGRSGAFDNKPRSGWVDSALIKDIDFEGMRAENIKKANEDYDKLESVLKGRKVPSWTKILASVNDDVEKAREIYHSDPVKNDLTAAGIIVFGDYEEEFKNSREEYLEDAASRTAMPYALVKDGKWYQKGEMGWFGISHDEKEQSQWNDEVWKLLNELPGDTLVTLLDCHI